MSEKKYKFDPEHTFFTSDTHFGHANIIRFCNRPFKNVEEMDEALIENWNQVVSEDDTVFHLGDFAFGGSSVWNSIIPRLNGHINLIIGNHDRKNLRQGYMSYFDMVVPQLQIEIEDNSIYLNHYPFLCYGGDHIEEYGNYLAMFTPDHKLMVWIFLDLGYYYRLSMMSELIIIILPQYHIGKLKKKQNLRRMKVWIGLSPDDVQGMEFDLTPLELRDLIGKPNWVPTKFLGWRTWKTSVYFKIII